MPSTDYPEGDGLPDCPQCKGRGVVTAPPKKGVILPRTARCPCILHRDILANTERGWRGLAAADKVPYSPLLGKTTKNLRITSSTHLFKVHLRHVAVRHGPNWHFAVVSDADLMDAWLARVDDKEVYDGDVSQMRQTPVTGRYGALVDLVEPPTLLVILTGVKAARNSAMPEVLLEVIQHRTYRTLPTWVVDHPDHRLAAGHLSFDANVGRALQAWESIKLTAASGELPSAMKPKPAAPLTLCQAFGGDEAPDEDDTTDQVLEEDATRTPTVGKRTNTTVRSELDTNMVITKKKKW